MSGVLADFVSRNSSSVWVGVSYTVQIIFTNNLSVCLYPHWLCASACTIILQMNSLKCLSIHCWHLFCLIEIISSPSKLSFYDTSKLWNVLFSIIYKPYKLFLNFLFSCPRACFYVSMYSYNSMPFILRVLPNFWLPRKCIFFKLSHECTTQTALLKCIDHSDVMLLKQEYFQLRFFGSTFSTGVLSILFFVL